MKHSQTPSVARPGRRKLYAQDSQRERVCRFDFLSYDSRPGITFLLVILILSALLAISINIFNTVFGQIRLSGEIGDSLVALYAADQGIEYLLWCDRVAGANCDSAVPPCLGGTGNCTYGPQSPGTGWSSAAAGSCTTVVFTRTGANSALTSSGEFRCGNPQVSVKRAFRAFYSQ